MTPLFLCLPVPVVLLSPSFHTYTGPSKAYTHTSTIPYSQIPTRRAYPTTSDGCRFATFNREWNAFSISSQRSVQLAVVTSLQPIRRLRWWPLSCSSTSDALDVDVLLLLITTRVNTSVHLCGAMLYQQRGILADQLGGIICG